MDLRSWWVIQGSSIAITKVWLKWKHISNKQCIDGVKHRWSNLVTVAHGARGLPSGGTGAAEARGGMRDGRLGAQRRVMVLTADEFRLRWRTLPHLPQTCCEAGRHRDTAAVDFDWNRYRVKSRWAERERCCTDETCGNREMMWAKKCVEGDSYECCMPLYNISCNPGL